MPTVQEVMDLARLDLNDSSTSPRYPDTELLKYANDGIVLAYALRPDLKFGNYSTSTLSYVGTSVFPLPDEYRPALAAYIVKRNQDGDDEFTLNGRASQSMIEFIKGLGLG